MLSRILYEDKDIIVAYKPAGLPVQTARVGQPDMVSELKNHLCRARDGKDTSAGRGEPYLGIVHRLDQPVEGILVFAKNRAAAASLTGQLRAQGDNGGFCKRYYAIVCGEPTAREGRLEDYLYKQAVKNGKHMDYRSIIDSQNHPEGRRGQHSPAVGEDEKAVLAVLEYRILEIEQGRWRTSASTRADSTKSAPRWPTPGCPFWETGNTAGRRQGRWPRPAASKTWPSAPTGWASSIPCPGRGRAFG